MTAGPLAKLGAQARRSIDVLSPVIAPGDEWETVISPRWFVGGETDLRFDFDAESWARFELVRAAPLTSDEVERFSRGAVKGRPGLLLRVRNRAAEAHCCHGWAIVTPNVPGLQRTIELEAEREWREGGTGDELLDAPQPDTFEDDLARAIAAKSAGR
jgi:hypothetical protein